MTDPVYYMDGQLFVGRQREQEDFRHLLQGRLDPKRRANDPAIVLLYGNGGMGKTSLARRFQEIAMWEPPFEGEFETVWLDWEGEKRKHGELKVGRENIKPETVFERLYSKLMQTNLDWEEHFFAYQNRRTQQEEAEQAAAKALLNYNDSEELTNRLSHVSTALLAKVLRLNLPIGETGEQVAQAFLQAGVEVAANQAQGLRTKLSTYLQAKLNRDEYRWFLNPHEQLAHALGHGLREIAKRQRLVLFLDTYEIVDGVDIWVREVIQTAGGNVVWVIAGRHDLVKSRQFGNDYFQGYSYDFPRGLHHYDMVQLAAENVQAYLADRVPERVPEPEEIGALTRVTRGIPLAMKATAELWRKGVALADIVGDITTHTPHKEIVKRMTERYLLHAIDNEQDKRAIYALAWARGNMTMLTAMLADEPMEISPRLAELRRAYAAIHLDEARLHDEPADFIATYLYRDELRASPTLQQMQERAVTALEEKLKKREAVLPLLEERAEDEEWVQLTLDRTRTLFWLDEQRGWKYLIPQFVAGLAYSEELTQGLMAVVGACRPFLSQQGKRDEKALREGIRTWAFLSSNIEEKAEMTALLVKVARPAVGWLPEPEQRAIVRWQQAEIATKQGEYELAVRLYNRVYDLLPDRGKRLREQVGAGMYDLAGKLLWSDKLQLSIYHPLAVGLLQKAVTCDPNNGSAWYQLGEAYEVTWNITEAIEAYEQVIQIEARATPYNGLGNVYDDLGIYEKAIGAYGQVIEIDIRYAYLPHKLGNLYQAMGRHEEAIGVYEQAIYLDPTDAYPHHGLGNVYYQLGRYEEATGAYEQAIYLNPTYANPYHGLGNVYYQLGRYEEAIEVYEQIIELQPHLVFCLSLAGCYRRLGRQAAYEAILEKARLFLETSTDPYNKACFASIAGEADEAVKLLAQAIERGEGHRISARTDPDFDFIRDDPRFVALVEDEAE